MNRLRYLVIAGKIIKEYLCMGLLALLPLVFLFNGDRQIGSALLIVCSRLFSIIILICYFIAYRRYLDDIFFDNTKTIKGHITSITKSRHFPYDRKGGLPEKLYTIKRLNVILDSRISFDCYYKKLWSSFKKSAYIEIKYLAYSKIIVEANQLDEAPVIPDKTICLNPKHRNRNQNAASMQSTLYKPEKVKCMTVLRSVVFSVVCTLVYLLIVLLVTGTFIGFIPAIKLLLDSPVF